MWHIGGRCNPKDYEGLSDKQYVFVYVLLVTVAIVAWWVAYYALCVPFGASPEFWPCLWSGIKFYGVIAIFLCWLSK